MFNKLVFLGVLLILFSSVATYAQVTDTNNTSTSIPAVESNNNSNSGFLDVKPIENTGLTTPNSNKVNGMSIPNNSNLDTNQNQFSMFGESFGNPGEIYEKQIKRQAESVEKKLDERFTGSTKDQYLGDFKTKAAKVNIIYRDHQYPDGDLVRIFVNDDVVKPQVLLQQSFSGFKLELVKGFNKIDFLALNQGESGPNTAELQILDDEGNVIAQSQWNLATGVKATLIVVKE